jgi:hypothetical protein
MVENDRAAARDETAKSRSLAAAVCSLVRIGVRPALENSASAVATAALVVVTAASTLARAFPVRRSRIDRGLSTFPCVELASDFTNASSSVRAGCNSVTRAVRVASISCVTSCVMASGNVLVATVAACRKRMALVCYGLDVVDNVDRKALRGSVAASPWPVPPKAAEPDRRKSIEVTLIFAGPR